MILAKAAELSAQSSSQGGTSRGLSLLEMKTIGKEVGLDPELIERAAHLVPGVTTSTLLGRLFGGPLSSQLEFYVPVRLTLEGAQQLLSLVRATVLTQGRGEATASGMSFSSFEAWLKIFVSAHVDGDGTRIRVVVDHRSGLVMPLVLASLGTDGGHFGQRRRRRTHRTRRNSTAIPPFWWWDGDCHGFAVEVNTKDGSAHTQHS